MAGCISQDTGRDAGKQYIRRERRSRRQTRHDGKFSFPWLFGVGNVVTRKYREANRESRNGDEERRETVQIRG